jgi:hypothetical protein
VNAITENRSDAKAALILTHRFGAKARVVPLRVAAKADSFRIAGSAQTFRARLQINSLLTKSKEITASGWSSAENGQGGRIMALSAFDYKGFMPNDEMTAAVLGSSFSLWKTIKIHFTENYKNTSEEWKFYGKESGWTKNIKSGKRTMFWFCPMNGMFQVGFTLGEKAVAAVHSSDLSKEITSLIPDAKACVCGYGLRLDIKTVADADAVIKLIAIKDKN